MPKRRRKATPPAYTAEEMRYINAWFDMIDLWTNGHPDAWRTAYERHGLYERPAPASSARHGRYARRSARSRYRGKR